MVTAACYLRYLNRAPKSYYNVGVNAMFHNPRYATKLLFLLTIYPVALTRRRIVAYNLELKAIADAALSKGSWRCWMKNDELVGLPSRLKVSEQA